MKKSNKAKVSATGISKTGGFIDSNGKVVPLTTIRGKFDGLAQQAHALPEGKQKNELLNAIETAYVDMVSWFQGYFPATAANA